MVSGPDTEKFPKRHPRPMPNNCRRGIKNQGRKVSNTAPKTGSGKFPTRCRKPVLETYGTENRKQKIKKFPPGLGPGRTNKMTPKNKTRGRKANKMAPKRTTRRNTGESVRDGHKHQQQRRGNHTKRRTIERLYQRATSAPLTTCGRFSRLQPGDLLGCTGVGAYLTLCKVYGGPIGASFPGGFAK